MTRALIAAAALLSLAACQNPLKEEEPKFGTLSRTLLLVDAEGTRYGTIEMDPVSGGKLMDTQGRVIGTVITPAVTTTTTTTAPVVTPAY